MPRGVICSVFRRRRRRRGPDAEVSRVYYARLGLPGERVQVVNLLTTDKRVAEKRAQDRLRSMEHEAAGIAVAEPLAAAAQRSCREHVAEYVADLRATGRDAMYVYTTERRLLLLIDACGWGRLRDVKPESFVRWRGGRPRCRRSGRELSGRTLNQYLETVWAWSSWLKSAGRVAVDLLGSVAKVDVRGRAPTFKRRALTVPEREALRAASPPERWAVYLLALTTGLRRGELEHLTWGMVETGPSGVVVRVPAGVTKGKREAVFRVRDDVYAALLALPGPREASSRMLRVPCIQTLRKDLAAAGVPLTDARGHRVDFHALRHTFCTDLACDASVSDAVRQRAMRHTDPRLTAQTYTDPARLDTWGVVEKLPRYPSAKGTREGTTDLRRTGQTLTNVDARRRRRNSDKTPEKQGSGRDQTRRVSAGRKTGVLGFEPRLTESESVVLPLHHTPFSPSFVGPWVALPRPRTGPSLGA